MTMSNLSPEMQRKLILSVGTHRAARPLTPIEVAEAFEVELSAGTSARVLASSCHLESATMVGRFRKLLALSPEIRHLVDWGQGPSTISFSVATQLARLPLPKHHEEVVRAALENGLTSKETQQVVQVVERAGVSPSEAVQQVLQLRPAVEKVHLFVGAIHSGELSVALKRLTQAERDALLQSALNKHLPSVSVSAGRLGVDRFSLVGASTMESSLRALPNGFERTINDILQLEVFLK